MQTIVLLWLVGWFVVVPCLIVGLRLRRARFAEALAGPARMPRRVCEGRSRPVWTPRARVRPNRSL